MACCVFEVITLFGSNQRNAFENATACSKKRVWQHGLKLSCHIPFQHIIITSRCCIFEVITLFGSNQRNVFENATPFSKCRLKTRVATRLTLLLHNVAFLKYLLWLAQTIVITLKMQRNAVIVYVETACLNEHLH